MEQIKGLTNSQYILLGIDKTRAMQKYYEAGNQHPTYALTLISEVYNSMFAKETALAHKAGKDELSASIQETFDVLKTLTETKLYNAAAAAFKKGEEFTLSFNKGKPDQQTAEFFNIKNPVAHNLNITRTSAVRLPESFYVKDEQNNLVPPQCCDFVLKPEGAWLFREHHGSREEIAPPTDTYQTEIAMQSIKNEFSNFIPPTLPGPDQTTITDIDQTQN